MCVYIPALAWSSRISPASSTVQIRAKAPSRWRTVSSAATAGHRRKVGALGEGEPDVAAELGEPSLLLEHGVLPLPLGDVAEDQDDPGDRPLLVPDRGRAVVDRRLVPVPADQQRVVRQADDDPFAEDLRHRILDGPAGPLVDDREDLAHRPPLRLGLGPAGEAPGRRG